MNTFDDLLVGLGRGSIVPRPEVSGERVATAAFTGLRKRSWSKCPSECYEQEVVRWVFATHRF